MKLEGRQLSACVQNALDEQIDTDGYISYLRFSEKQMAFYAENSFFRLMSQCSSGVCFSFMTDGEILKLDCRTADLSRKVLQQIKGEMTFSEILQKLGETVIKVNQARSRLDIIQHFDLYQDTHYLDAVRLGDSEIEFKLDNPQRQPVHVKIWLPLYKPLSIRSLDADGSIQPVQSARPRMLALGDSITQGFVAGKPSFNYVSQLAEFLDVDAINQGIGSMVHDKGILTDWENLPQPDLVTTAYGTNDWHSGKLLPEIEADMAAYFQRLAFVFPDIPIFVITPIWRDDLHKSKECGSFQQLVACLSQQAIDAAGSRVHLIDGLEVSPHNPACFSDGWLHPNIAGFSYMAPRLYKTVKDWQIQADLPDKTFVSRKAKIEG